MRKTFYLGSFLMTGVLLFSGCGLSQVENTVEAQVEVKEESEALLSGNDNPVEEVTVEKEASAAVPDNSYMIEDLCRVSENYDETLGGAPADLIVGELIKDHYDKMVLLSHTVDNDKKTDTVKYKIVTDNVSGKCLQYIVCNAVFEEDGDTWRAVSNEWTEWDVEWNELKGTSWKCDEAEKERLSRLFTEGLNGEDGTLYVRLKKNLNVIAPLKNEDPAILETRFGTKFNGTLLYVAGDEKEEIEFSCIEGTLDDEGKISFKLETEAGEEFFTPGEGNEYLTEYEFNKETADDPDGVKFIDSFEVTSESIDYGGWKKEIGRQNGNISPELSWEEVEGAAQYAVMLVDLNEGNYHLHGYGLVSENHIGAGEMNEYVGPYLEGYHNYKAYVFALKEDVSDVILNVDNQNVDETRLVELYTKNHPDNVIAIGNITNIYDFY